MGIEQDILDLKGSVEKLTAAFTAFTKNQIVPPGATIIIDTLPKKEVVPEVAQAEVTPPGQRYDFAQVRSEVIKWIGPLARADKTAAKEATKKLLDKFTGGEPLTKENTPEENLGLILEYIQSAEAK